MRPIAVTMGCPVGVGPEILLRFFETLEHSTEFPPVVLGDYTVLSRTAEQLRLRAEPVLWEPGNGIRPGTVPVMALSQLDTDKLLWGKPTQDTSIAMADYIHAAVRHTRRGDFAAMVTCPISKKALNNAVKAAEAEKKREAAKQRAIKEFVAKWEQEHKKRQVKRKPAKKKTSKKKVTA